MDYEYNYDNESNIILDIQRLLDDVSLERMRENDLKENVDTHEHQLSVSESNDSEVFVSNVAEPVFDDLLKEKVNQIKNKNVANNNLLQNSISNEEQEKEHKDEDITVLQREVEKNIGTTYISSNEKAKIFVIRELRKVLSRFNRDYRQFLTFMEQESKRCVISPDYIPLILTCLFWEEPQYCYKAFESYLFSTSHIAQGTFTELHLFIEDTKKYFRMNDM